MNTPTPNGWKAILRPAIQIAIFAALVGGMVWAVRELANVLMR